MSDRQKAEREIRHHLLTVFNNVALLGYKEASAKADDLLRAAIGPLEKERAVMSGEVERAIIAAAEWDAMCDLDYRCPQAGRWPRTADEVHGWSVKHGHNLIAGFNAVRAEIARLTRELEEARERERGYRGGLERIIGLTFDSPIDPPGGPEPILSSMHNTIVRVNRAARRALAKTRQASKGRCTYNGACDAPMVECNLGAAELRECAHWRPQEASDA